MKPVAISALLRFYCTSNGTRTQRYFARIKKYWLNLADQYWMTVKDTGRDSIAHPYKTVFYISSLYASYYLYSTNPNEVDFKDAILRYSALIGTVNPKLVRKDSLKCIEYLKEAYSLDVVRYQSCGLFSLIWIDRFNKENCLFESQCKYLTINWRNFYQHIIDVGFCDRWWILERKMKDFDIADDENS